MVKLVLIRNPFVYKYYPVICCDFSGCTEASCDKQKGWQYTLFNCDDGDACTWLLLQLRGGVYKTSLLDNRACTEESCDIQLDVLIMCTANSCDNRSKYSYALMYIFACKLWFQEPLLTVTIMHYWFLMWCIWLYCIHTPWLWRWLCTDALRY